MIDKRPPADDPWEVVVLSLPLPALQHVFVYGQAYISHRSCFFLAGFRKEDRAQLCLS